MRSAPRFKFHSGFTLIELIIVIAILMILSATTFVGFNRYNQNQRLNSSTDDLRNNLNEAKSNALSGLIYQCTSTQTLYGYKINVDSASSYRLYVVCRANVSPFTLTTTGVTNKLVTLPTGVAFDGTVTPINTSVTFQSVTGLPDSAGPFNFRLNSGSSSRTVTVDSTGIIK